MPTMRDAFGLALTGLAEERDDFIVLDPDVGGGTGINVFKERFPHRVIQCGIAEQNMMSMAAGIASTGLIPIVACYAVFASMRAVEQARNSIAYPNFNVKIAASHLGLDVGPDGATHQAIEDIAIMRAIPNMRVVSPADPVELRAALEVIIDHYGPVYLRTGRSPVSTIFKEGDVGFKFGRSLKLREGSDVTIAAAGVMVKRALMASDTLHKMGIQAAVLNISSIKPIDKTLIIECAKETKAFVTAEDHNIIGGMGSAVCEVLSQHCPAPVEMVGIKDKFGSSGDPEELITLYGIDDASIVEAVKRVIKRKR